jgi:hypothetical protein
MCAGPLLVHADHIGCRSSIRLYPLYSWYHTGFDTEIPLTNSLYLEYTKMVPFEMMWMDFRQCQWPPDIVSHAEFANIDENSTALAALFASINDTYLPLPHEEIPNKKPPQTQTQTRSVISEEIDQTDDDDDADRDIIVISFSHFVPCIELIPEKRFLLEPSLARVSGSDILAAQIRQLKPDIHIVSRVVNLNILSINLFALLT